MGAGTESGAPGPGAAGQSGGQGLAGHIGPRPVRLFVLARINVYIEGLITIIGRSADYEVVGCAQPGNHCFARFTRTDSDVVLVHEDALVEPLDEFFGLFRGGARQPGVLVFGGGQDAGRICQAMCAGADGYLGGDMRTEELYAAIDAVRDGRLWLETRLFEVMRRERLDFDARLKRQVGRRVQALREELSPRELQVLHHALEGRTTAEISARIHLSEQGVKLYLGRLFRHFRAGNRAQLLGRAYARLLPELEMGRLLAGDD